MNNITSDILMHYGMPRRSGRYPWGSGDEPYQHSRDFVARVTELRNNGMKEIDIAAAVGCRNTSDLRLQYSNAANARKLYDRAHAKSMKSDGYSNADIARAAGVNESTVRSWLDESSGKKLTQAQKTADFLRNQVETKGMIDVGVGVERELGVSRDKMRQAIETLKEEGYVVYGGGVPQVTNPGRQTNVQVLCPPGTQHKEIYDFNNVHSITDYKVHQDADGNDIFDPGFVYPKSMDSSRIKVRYAEEGGIERDGTVEIRRNVPDLSLGESHYAQVRVLVDGTHFVKAMAVYADDKDLPDGVDMIFNTNKPKGTPLMSDEKGKPQVLKPIKSDPDNPFGALIKENGGQSYYFDEKGERQLSLINKRSDEGDWGDWSDSLPSQFLSKQNKKLIQSQLTLALDDKKAEYDELCALTNPTVKKEMLASFADDCDAASVHLQAAALPRQKYKVILPIPGMKDTDVYAPGYEDGEVVALVRYPHGGTFEIPVLRVNNKNPNARNLLGTTPADAIGINSKVAERLSGADFDGDTVMIIPCNEGNKVKITTTPQLSGLDGFDPKMKYGATDIRMDKNGNAHYYNGEREYKTMHNTQNEMGRVSNLITDMTLKGASSDELARAVRHSMVVIDAEKHHLDYHQSEVDNNIAALKQKYQARVDEDGKYHEGASTLISRAKSDVQVTKRKGSPIVDPDTGEVTYKEVHETYVDKKGKTQERTQAVPLMSVTRDAHDLSTGTVAEELYADYANGLKALANSARKEMMHTGKIEYSAAAKATYQPEVDSLMAQLNIALMNAPRERQAQLAANSVIKAKKADNPDMTGKEIKKAGQQALAAARTRYGAKRTPIRISDREWEAIQSGAISETTLSRIIKNTDIDSLRARATPRATTALSTAKQAKIRSMRNSGYTTRQIAQAVGCSSSTVSNYILGKE